MSDIKKLLLFSVFMALFCGGYVLLAPGQTALAQESWRHDLGEVAGSAVLWLFALIYGRTLLKILLRQGPLLERLLPQNTADQAANTGKKILPFLNKTHPYAGAATVLLIACHALLEGLNQANLLMQVILFLIAWQFAFGLFLLSRYQAVFVKKIKKYSYLAHSQLYTGVAIGLCALFGHFLVQG